MGPSSHHFSSYCSRQHWHHNLPALQEAKSPPSNAAANTTRAQHSAKTISLMLRIIGETISLMLRIIGETISLMLRIIGETISLMQLALISQPAIPLPEPSQPYLQPILHHWPSTHLQPHLALALALQLMLALSPSRCP